MRPLISSERPPSSPDLTESAPEALLGRRLRTPAEVEQGAAELLASGRSGAVLIKGGHSFDTDAECESGEGGGGARTVAQDYYCEGRADATGLEAGGWWLSGGRIASDETHGTGCTLSSAIAAALAHGLSLLDAVVLAKAYVTQGIGAAVRLGSGPGPVAHTRWPDEAAAMPWLTRTASQGVAAPAFARCEGIAGLCGRPSRFIRLIAPL